MQTEKARVRRTSYPVAAGILIIVSACFIILAVIASVLQSWSLFEENHGIFFMQESPFVAISFLLAILAIVAGAMALTRKHYTLAVIGATVLFTWGIGSIPSLIVMLTYAGNSIYYVANIVPFILSIPSLFFLAKSRSEFT